MSRAGAKAEADRREHGGPIPRRSLAIHYHLHELERQRADMRARWQDARDRNPHHCLPLASVEWIALQDRISVVETILSPCGGQK